MNGNKKSKSQPNDKEESARFIETPEQVQFDYAQEAFEETIGKIIKNKQVTKRIIS